MSARDRRLRAFRAADEFAVEVFRVTRRFSEPEGRTLAGEIRRATVRAGGALVAASWGDREMESLGAARERLLEARYYLSLARRLGFLEGKAYRQLTVRQDAAIRELLGLLGPSRRQGPSAPGPGQVDSAPNGC